MIHYKILLLWSIILPKPHHIRETAVSEWAGYKWYKSYRLCAWQMFRESLSIRSRRRHNASAMVVWAPLLFSQWAGSRLSCSLVRWASRLCAVVETGFLIKVLTFVSSVNVSRFLKHTKAWQSCYEKHLWLLIKWTYYSPYIYWYIKKYVSIMHCWLKCEQ